jgi:hypothetical protein
VHHHQNHLQTVNQYSTNLQLLQLQLRRHWVSPAHFYGHNKFSHLNPSTSAPIKYENVLNC